MNLFRSEEHVQRWSLYSRTTEDYIMSVAEWAKVFSNPLVRNRLEPDYLVKAEQYVEEYHAALRAVGKTSPFWQYPTIAAMDVVKLARYRVAGNYTRFEEAVLNALKDARQGIFAALDETGHIRSNYLIWAAPGSGKTFLIQEIARQVRARCEYDEINLAKQTEESFRTSLENIVASQQPRICLIDECDAKADAAWPYEVLLPFLDTALTHAPRIIFVMAGSSGFSLEGMKESISARSKGNDLISRIPVQNQIVIPPLSFGDRVLVVLSQIVEAAQETGHEIRAVEKLGLYHIALNPRLTNARQLREFAVRAVERVPRGDDRLKYDHLFVPGDPENKRFWLDVSPVATELVNHYVLVEP